MRQRTERRTDEEWSRLAKEMYKSGQIQKVWCRQHGINIRSLKDWERRYRQKKQVQETGNPTTPQGWIAVEDSGLSNQNDQISSPSKENIIEVRIGFGVIRVLPDFDRVLFTEVCKALSSLC